jgi:homoserine kinase
VTPGASRAGSLIGRRVVVEVPATIANLGAGFDCLGIAIDLALRVEVTAVRGARGGRVEVAGEGVGEISSTGANRFLEALEAGLASRSVRVDPEITWQIAMRNEIPLARGLGSSAAAVVAGLLAAAALAGLGEEIDPRALLAAAAAIEGHPDNVAPALLGGLVASSGAGPTSSEGGAAYRFEAPDGLRVVLLIPERRIATQEMRAILPPTVPRTDAVATLGRATAAMAGIASGDWSALRLLNGDRLHEPYRAAVYPELPVLVESALAAGAKLACLAGSGSSVAAFTLDDEARTEAIAAALARAAANTGLPAQTSILAARNRGGRVLDVG